MEKLFSPSRMAVPRLFFGLLLIALTLGPGHIRSSARSADTLKELSDAFGEAAKKVAPSVVWISTSREVQTGGSQPRYGIPPDHPLAPFFREFFDDIVPRERGDEEEEGEMRGERPIGMASGLIVSSDGYILTNYHVIAGADVIEVIVEADGRQKTYRVTEPARTDKDTDLAVIKIDASGLPVPQFGDSDELEVGEWVLAIGNSFGLSGSVTAGIISYIGRPRGGRWIGSFIQTDAAINPGNSGGPLVNMDGEVIGINSMIATGGPFERSYAGVGFTIPGNLVKRVKDDLIEQGEVVRGFLGVLISNVDEEFAEHTGLENRDGALIQNVGEDSPAEQAGLQVEDVIIEYEGEPVSGSSDLQAKVAATEPGKKARLKVLRYEDESWEKKTFTATIGTRGKDVKISKARVSSPSQMLGMTVQKLTDELAERFGYEPGSGVLVTNVVQFGPAHRKGIQRYDLIREVNHVKVRNVSDFKEAVAKRDDSALLVVERQDEGTFIKVIKLE